MVRPTTRTWPRRCGQAVAVLAGLGGAAQALATRVDRRRYPPPGRMVDIGGYRLHLHVQGQDRGGPTVVLDAGFGSFSSNWYWVQRALADHGRVVAYDRAGLGWSDRGPAPRDAEHLAGELHAALRQAGIGGPYVLAGHSFGGLPVRAFAARYPDETAGVVLVDAMHPDQWARWPVPHADRLLAASQRIASVLARVGVLRLADLSATISAGLPARQVAELRARSALPGFAATEAEQMDAWPATRAQVNAAGDLGDLPLFVLGVGDQPRGGELLTLLQSHLPALSTDSVRRVVSDATHETLVAERRHAETVARAVCAVVESARTGRPLREVHHERGTDD